MKEFNENTVRQIQIDISKVICKRLKISQKDLTDIFIACSCNWNTTLQTLFIMQKKKVEFEEAIRLYVSFLKTKTGGHNHG